MTDDITEGGTTVHPSKLDRLAAKVESAHRPRHPELVEVRPPRRPIIPSMFFTHIRSSRPLPALDLNLQNFYLR